MSYRSADLEGLGWAFVAYATSDLAKVARERLNGKTLPGISNIPFMLDAVLGEGLYGNVRRYEDPNSPWKETRSPKGEVYYYHEVTRQTSWTKPLLEQPPAPPPPAGGMRPPFGQPPPPGKGRPAGGLLSHAPPPPPLGSTAASIAAQAAVLAAQATAGVAQAQRLTAGSGPVGGNLFVYHIPASWDDGILKQHFEHFGNIVSCRIQKDDLGRARGFGFVSFDAADGAASAISGMHGFPVEGKWLKVQLKKGDEQAMDPGGAPGVPPPPPGLPVFGSVPQPPPPRPGPY